MTVCGGSSYVSGGPATVSRPDQNRGARRASRIGIDLDQRPWRWLLLSNMTLGILGQQATDAA
jgi:hypothetical protein